MSKKLVIEPLNDRILVSRESSEDLEKSSGGIYYAPNSQAADNISKGTVLALGSGRVINGQLVPFSVKVGDKVVYIKRATTEFPEDGVTHVTVKEADIIAVVKYIENE